MIGLSAYDAFRQGPQIGRKADVGRLRLCIKTGQAVGNPIRIRFLIDDMADIFIFHPECIIFVQPFQEGDRSGRSIRRAGGERTMSGVENADRTGGAAFLGNGKMHEHFPAWNEIFIFYPQSGLQMYPVFQKTLFFHELYGAAAVSAAFL